MPHPAERFDRTVDVLIAGSGAGGFVAALAAHARGLEPLLVEKASKFGGTSALSGGGVWVPGAPAQQRAGHRERPNATLTYLRHITEGRVSDARLRAYVDYAPQMMALLESASAHLRFIWKPGYPDYYPEAPGGSAQGSVINVPPMDLRDLGADEKKLLPPLALAPKGLWIGPSELRDFFRLRQTWSAKLLFVRLLWRMTRSRLFGERIVTIGQSLVARLMLAFREKDLELWLDCPLRELIQDDTGAVVGAVVRRDGRERRIGARRGVLLTTGGFDHNALMRAAHVGHGDGADSLGTASDVGDGIAAGQAIGAGVDLMDAVWWNPAFAVPGGGTQLGLNERMMPAVILVNGEGERYTRETTPYEELGRQMIDAERAGVPSIPSWLITDDWSWRRYVVFGHLPLPRIPFAPVPTGRALPKRWLETGVAKKANSIEELARQIHVPAGALTRTVDRYNRLAATGLDEDFQRGKSVYDHYYADPTVRPNPNLLPLHGGPYYAFKLILADLGTKGGLMVDERARVLRPEGSAIAGLYASGNTSASLMGYSYAGAGATLGPAMTFAYVAAQDMADHG